MFSLVPFKKKTETTLQPYRSFEDQIDRVFNSFWNGFGLSPWHDNLFEQGLSGYSAPRDQRGRHALSGQGRAAGGEREGSRDLRQGQYSDHQGRKEV